MPIPSYQRRVQLHGLPSARVPSATAQDLVGGIPQALGAAAGVAAQIAEKERSDAQRARLMEAYSQLGSSRLGLETQYKDFKGSAALKHDVVRMASEGLREQADLISRDLDEDSRLRFREMYLRENEGLTTTLTAHVSSQVEQVGSDSYKAALGTASNKAATAALGISPDKPGAERAAAFTGLAQARKEALEAVEGRALSQGWTGEVLDQERRIALSALHAKVVETMQGADRAAEAEAYLNHHAPEMDATVVADVRKKLEPAALVNRAERAVRAIQALHPGDDKAQVDAVQKLEGDVGVKAADVLRERQADRKRAVKEQQGEWLGTVFDSIEQGATSSPSKLEKHPQFVLLDKEGQARARAYLRQLRQAERSIAASERAAQLQADQSMVKDFEARPPEERATLDLRGTYAGRVSTDGLNVLRKLQQGAQRDWNKDRGLSAGEFKTFAISEVQGLPQIREKEDLDAYVAWMNRKRAQWQEDPNNAGQEPPRDLVRNWVIEAVEMGDYVKGNSLLYRDRPRFKASPNQAFYPLPAKDQPYIQRRGQPASEVAPAPGHPAAPAPARAPLAYDDIPSADRGLIEAAMKAKGKTPTPDAVLARYLLAHPEKR